MKKFWISRIENELNPNDETRSSLNNVMRDLAKLNKPKKFSPGEGNVLILHLSEFQKQSALLEKHYGVRADTLTFYEFASRLEMIKEDLQTQTKHPGLQFEAKPEQTK